MSLPDLLKEIRKPHSAGDRSNASGVPVSHAELVWLRHFHDVIRNQFMHFDPKGWTIEVSGIPQISKLIARIINDIYNFGYAFRHLEPSERVELNDQLDLLLRLDWRLPNIGGG